MDYEHIKKQDKEVFDAIMGEEEREAEGIELIPSENYVSRAVREANSSIFTNKYSEGYAGKRYYGGQTYTDIVETIAVERAKKLFGAGFANVQSHAGAPANVAMYFALLEPGDTVMGMDLSHGTRLRRLRIRDLDPDNLYLRCCRCLGTEWIACATLERPSELRTIPVELVDTRSLGLLGHSGRARWMVDRQENGASCHGAHTGPDDGRDDVIQFESMTNSSREGAVFVNEQCGISRPQCVRNKAFLRPLSFL